MFTPTKLNQAILSSLVFTVPTISMAAEISLPAQPLNQAITQLAKQTNLIIGGDSALLNNKKSSAVKGDFSPEQALQKLLTGSGLEAVKQGNGSFILKKLVNKRANSNTAGTLALTKVGSEGTFGDAPEEDGGFKAKYQKTATKMAMSLKETPQAISVVTRDSLDARLVKDLSSAIELTAGVNGTNRGAPGTFAGEGQFGQGFSLRGEELKYYRDVRSDGFSAGVLAAYDLSAYERVEVIKGPSGFYGQGSLGGFINLVRKKPQKEFAANVSGQIGSYNTYRTEADVTGSLTNNGQLQGRLTLAYEDADAFIDDVNANTVIFAPSLEAQITDNTRILLQMLYQKEQFNPSAGMPMITDGDRYKPYDLPRSKLFGAVGSEDSNADILDTTLRVDHEISDRWLASLLLQANETNRNIIMNNSNFDLFGTSGVKHDTESTAWAGELRLEGKFDVFDREHQLLFGLEKNQRKLDMSYGYGYIGPVDIYNDNFADAGFMLKKDIPTTMEEKNNNKNQAVYAQTVLSLHERTKLLISGRYDWSDIDSEFSTPWEDTSHDTLSKEAFTMRIGLTQELSDNISTYASYGQSFNPVTSSGKNGKILEPETGDGFELGLKGNWFNSRLGTTLALYRQELDNRPITDPESLTDADPTSTYSMSAGLHKSDGIELEVTGSPVAGLSLTASASWSNNEFIDKKDVNYGLSADGTIDQQYSLYAHYEVQQGVLKGLGYGVTLVSLGERQYIFGQGQMYIDGYERVDFNISYQAQKNWDVSLLVRNAFDKRYVENAQAGGSAWNYYGSPRAVLLKATYHL